jgi:hypothetical protein
MPWSMANIRRLSTSSACEHVTLSMGDSLTSHPPSWRMPRSQCWQIWRCSARRWASARRPFTDATARDPYLSMSCIYICPGESGYTLTLLGADNSGVAARTSCLNSIAPRGDILSMHGCLYEETKGCVYSSHDFSD